MPHDDTSLIAGAPIDTATGQPLPADARIPTGDMSAVGPAPTVPDSGIHDPTKPKKPGRAQKAKPARPDEPDEADQGDPLPMEPAAAEPPPVVMPIGIPRDANGWLEEGLPVDGMPVKKWSGDPDDPVMPGEIVLYWVPSDVRPDGKNAVYLVPWPVLVLNHLRDDDGAINRYNGVRFRSIIQGIYPVMTMAPAKLPKEGHFTARKKFPPESCRIRPIGA